MELGTYQLQVFISLIVILGAAFIALICDFLKGNNEQLREQNIELKVRREEEQRRVQMMVPQLAGAASGMTSAGLTSSMISAPMARVAAAEGKAAEAPMRKMNPASPRALATPRDGKRIVNRDAVAAMERGAQLAGRRPMQTPTRTEIQTAAKTAPAVAPRVTGIAQKPVEPVAMFQTPVVQPPVVETKMVPRSQVEIKIAAPVGPAPAPPVVAAPKPEPAPMMLVQMAAAPASTGSRKNWGSLLDAARKTSIQDASNHQENESLLEAVVAATTSSNAAKASEPTLPAGFQDGFVLRQLVQSHQPISGLVVSIGVNTPREADGSLPAQVNTLIQSLLGPEDFAAQSSKDEFLLIFPNERGASAQRRLSQVAQQLWDFQLRSLGTYSILFSWGGVEVRSESIDEAIASANERMQETKRGRKVLSMDALRKAV